MKEEKIEQLPLFVYGSLRVGASKYKLVRPYVISFRGGWLSGFQMYDFGLFPGIISGWAEQSVVGDILEIIPEMWNECIAVLDKYESNGFLFQRNRFTVRDAFEREVPCWVYTARTETLDFSGSRAVMSNDWMRREW